MAAVIYIFVLILAVRFCWRKGVATGSRKRALAYAAIGFLLVYLPFFWDHIPTVMAHRYYCAKDGGLTVYQDPDVWLVEHRDELDSLRVQTGGEPVRMKLEGGWERSYLLNKLVAMDVSGESFSVLGFVTVRRSAQRLTDISTGNSIATDVQYAVGKSFESGGLRAWLYRKGCSQNNFEEFGNIHRKLFVQEAVK